MAGKWVLSFKGIEDDYVDCGSADSLEGMTAITIETLIYPMSLIDYSEILGKYKPAPTLGSYQIFLNSSGAIYGDGRTTADWVISYSSEKVSINTWYHIATRWAGDGNDVETLLGGNLCTIAGYLVGSNPLDGTNIDINDASLWLGRYEFSPDNKYTGYIAYVRLWSNYRTDTQINQYKYKQINSPQAGLVLNLRMNEGEGDPQDASGYDNHGINYGATWTWVTDCPMILGKPAPMGRDLAGKRAIENGRLAR